MTRRIKLLFAAFLAMLAFGAASAAPSHAALSVYTVNATCLHNAAFNNAAFGYIGNVAHTDPNHFLDYVRNGDWDVTVRIHAWNTYLPWNGGGRHVVADCRRIMNPATSGYTFIYDGPAYGYDGVLPASWVNPW